MIPSKEVDWDSSSGAAVCPWLENPYALISWRDMQEFTSDIYFMVGQYLAETQMSLQGLSELKGNSCATVQPPEKDDAADQRKTLLIVKRVCSEIGLTVSVKAVQSVINRMSEPSTLGSLIDSIAELGNTIRWEMEDRLFFYMPPDRAGFYDKPEMLGKDVNAKFPTIQFDIVEAGNCYAAGRGTAVVFHLMRIMETGVQEFGTKLGVSLANEKNWQNILDEINKAIKALPAKDPQTVAMSQASANLYAVKLAWRNEVMHPKDTYTLEEAENLIRQVKIFMEQLAKIV